MNFFKKIFIIIFLSTKTFKKPEKKKILIIDKDLSDYLKKYLKNNYETIDTRFHLLPLRQLNLFILLKCFLKKKISFLDYVYEYIRYVQPKILITLIDNNSLFYKLKTIFPKIKTIMIQNATRTCQETDVLSQSKTLKKKNLSVDYYFCFNKAIGEKLRLFLNCVVVPIGSFRSNFHIKKTKKKKYDFMYISVYRGHINSPPEDVIFFKNLEKYLLKKNKTLTILGSQSFHQSNEYKFYKNIFKNINLNFIARTRKRNTYKILDQANISINIDSTAGYESLSRSNKVGFFCIRGNKYPFHSLKFGWPNSLKNKGLFWTDKNNYMELERVLKYLSKNNDQQFIKKNRKIINIVMKKNEGNKKFSQLINKLIRK